MLQQITFGQFLAFLFSVGGFVGIVTRLPKISAFWDALDPRVKNIVVAAVGILAPMALAAINVYVPPTLKELTLDQLVYTVFAAIASVVIGYLNDLLKAAVPAARLHLRTAAQFGFDKAK
jgi:hypothetical protein